jgi:hypothetical protein
MSNYTWRFNLTIDDVKKELSGDEQMLASAFKAEKIYKKHKLKIFTVIGIVIAYFAGTAIMETMAQDKREKANFAYLILEKDTTNADALNSLKINNPALFELFSYQEAVKTSDTDTLKSLSKSKNEIISDLSSYHLAVIEGKPSDSKFNSDIAKIHNAALFIKEGKTTEAKEELEFISEESPVFNISKMIKHYGIKD